MLKVFYFSGYVPRWAWAKIGVNFELRIRNFYFLYEKSSRKSLRSLKRFGNTA